MDDNILWKALLGLLAVVTAMISFASKKLIGDVEALKKSDAECKLDLANFKTEVATNYAKDATVQSSLSRIHDRIDSISDDIKQILQRVK